MDTEDNSNWREKGLGNWARDLGFVLTREGGTFTMRWADFPIIVLNRVELDDVERYLTRCPLNR